MNEPRTEAGKAALARLCHPNGTTHRDGTVELPALTLIALVEAEADFLGTAWRQAEAALPKGWTMLVGRERVTPFSYWATASGPHDPDTRSFPIVSTSKDGTLELTPTAALQALTALLRDKAVSR